jgi:predicted ATPase
VLCQVAGLEEHTALAGLEEILQHRLLRETTENDGRAVHGLAVATYSVGHDKVREVIYAEIGEAQRRHLHRRALSVLESLRRPAAELAQHAHAAGLAERAWQYSLMAGDEAVRLFANADAYDRGCGRNPCTVG